MSELGDLWKILWSVVSVGFGWFLKTLWTDHKETAKSLAELKVHIAENYATNAGMQKFKDEIFDRFNAFDEKLDQLFTPTDRRRGND